MSEGAGPGCDCKVGRVLAERQLATTDEELVDRWTKRDESLRDMAEWINVSVLQAAIRDAGSNPLDGEAENLYRLLTDDDVTRGMRMAARNRMAGEGIEVEAVERDFVSHQTVHTHLTGCLDASKTPAANDRPVDAERDRIRSLQNRLEAVTDDAIARLERKDELALDGSDVYVEVAVVCDACGRRHQLDALLSSGGCSCQLENH